MRVLVTGGTGYLGSAIVRAFARHGHDVVVFARHASAAGWPGTAIDGDIRNAGDVRRAVSSVDAVCHTAALVSLWQPDAGAFDEVNVRGLQHVLDACRELRTPRLVYTSSFLALPPAGSREPLCANDYQRTKVRALAVARDAAGAGLPLVTVCPGVIYGPGAATEGNLIGRLVRDHLRGKLPGIAGADRIWSFAFVDDVAEAHVSAMSRGVAGAEYLLGGENAPQMRVFEIVRELTGQPLPRQLPYWLLSAAGAAEELRAKLTRQPPRITRGAVRIFHHDWSLDSARSVDELSLRMTSLDNGVRALLAGSS